MRRSALILAVLLIGAGRASAQTAADLFDVRTLQEVRISMNPRDLQDLRDHYQEKIYFPADFVWRGIRVRSVGVRIRGLASRSPIKPGLHVDFNRYVTGQHFLGLKAVELKNVLEDPSMIRDTLAMEMFTRMGQPASRESFARVYLNDVYQGVYTIMESVNETFLQRTLGEDAGYLLKREFVSEYYGEDLGNPAAYTTVFEAKTHETDSDSVVFSPTYDLFHEVNHDLDTAWRSRVSQYLNLEQFVTHVAIEQFLSERDGVLGNSGMANFFLYRAGGSDTSRFIVWDKDRTFTAVDSSIYQGGDRNHVFIRAMAFPDLRALYLDVLSRCVQLLTTDNWMDAEIDRATALIQSSVYEDTAKPYTNDEYNASVAFLKQFVQIRPAFVLNQVAQELKSLAQRRR